MTQRCALAGAYGLRRGASGNLGEGLNRNPVGLGIALAEPHYMFMHLFQKVVHFGQQLECII
jgi:hypothetical protein